jgi:hypothetical protein
MEKEKYFLHIFMIINLLNSISAEAAYILMDHLFGQIQILDPICLMKDPIIVSVRGTVENLDDIIKIDPETELYENPYVYISEIEKLKYVNYFWDKTIFFTNFQISWDDIRHSICFVQIEKYYKYNYIIMSNAKMGYIFFPICLFFFAYSVPIAIFKLYKSELKRLVLFKKIHFYKFAQRLTLFWMVIIISSATIYYFLLSYVIYSLYKAYLVVNLLYLLEGYSIIHFNKSQFNFTKYFLSFFFYDAIISLYVEYIVYFLPNFDNFYLLHIKSLFEHVVFLIMILVYIFKRYVHMKKQYLLENRERTILAVGYQIKIKLYLKLMIFSIIYCSTFIIFPFIEKLYINIDNVVETYYANYFITMILETVFNLVLVIILFPKDLTIFFFLPTIFDYNTFKIEAIIKERYENKLQISNLKPNSLKNKYQERQYPLVIINPFTKTNNVFKDIRVGFIKKEKDS